MQRRQFLYTVAAGAVAAALAGAAQAQTISLNGASQFNDDHAFTKAMVRFEELVKKYYGKPINFTLHKNSELGLEKQYFEYMAQGKAVDYAIVSPAHMSTFSKAAPFIDAPFLFRDLNHWNKVLDQDVLKPVADEINQKAEVMLIGYAGGGTRNIFVNKPVRNLQEMKGLKVRVQGAPIWSRTFQATGMAPTVIAYNEVYNAIQNGVIAAGENEAAGVEQMKFYEVAPNLSMTEHAITIRPLCFSTKTFNKLAEGPPGRGAQGRQGGGRVRPRDRVERGRGQARQDGEGRQAQARPVLRPRPDEGAGRSGDGGVREGDRRRAASSRRSTASSSRPARTGRRRCCAPARYFRGAEMSQMPSRRRPLAPVHRVVRRGALLAARDLGRDPDRAREPADLLALHRADPELHLDRGDGAVPLHLDDHDRGDARHPRGHALRGRPLAADGRARPGRAQSRRRASRCSSSRWSSSGRGSSSRASPGTGSPSSPSCRSG